LNTNGVVSVEMNHDTLVLPVNPSQNLSQDFRTTVVQTLSGIYTDVFGPGIEQIQLSGTTAFNSGQGKWNGQAIDGDTAGRHLYKDVLMQYATLDQQGKNPVLNIYDDAFGRAWKVKPIGQLQLTRSPTDPITLNYSQTFLVIKDYMTNAPQTKIDDPIKSIWQNSKSVQSQTGQKVSQATGTAAKQKQTSPFKYTVVSGDNLWVIAKKYLPKQATNAQVANLVNKIVAANKLRNPNLIFPNQKLTIPAA